MLKAFSPFRTGYLSRMFMSLYIIGRSAMIETLYLQGMGVNVIYMTTFSAKIQTE